ncbi:MAG TPA: DnaA/Hda family protein, partial [Pseudomonadales bacterium]
MGNSLWPLCVDRLQDELPAQQFNTWIRPLQAEKNGHGIKLLAPNRFVLDWVSDKFLTRITELLGELTEGGPSPSVHMEIGTKTQNDSIQKVLNGKSSYEIGKTGLPAGNSRKLGVDVEGGIQHKSSLNPSYTFDNFIEGKSNQLARAAAMQVAENSGSVYNPLFLYGGSGLGKTHLMIAIGNQILAQNPHAKVVYLHSERFVADMVKALQINAINEFKRY